MHKKYRFVFLPAMLGSAAFAADDQRPMSLGYAQLASGKSIEEVKAADLNDDKHIDAAEFAALTVPAKRDKEVASN